MTYFVLWNSTIDNKNLKISSWHSISPYRQMWLYISDILVKVHALWFKLSTVINKCSHYSTEIQTLCWANFPSVQTEDLSHYPFSTSGSPLSIAWVPTKEPSTTLSRLPEARWVSLTLLSSRKRASYATSHPLLLRLQLKIAVSW